MNAVNLAPAGANRRRHRGGGGFKVSLSTPSLALIGGLLVVLLAAVLFVTAHDRVTSRRAELGQLQSGVAQWTSAASGFEDQVQQFTQRSRSLAGVRQLIADRYHWSLLLSQIAGVTPGDVQLSSLQASIPAAATAGSAATGTTGVTVAGCAVSHSAVAAAMVSLSRVTGIANVVLLSSAKGAASSAGSAPISGAGAAGGCQLPVQFQLTLVFDASASPAPAATPAMTTDSATGVAQ